MNFDVNVVNCDGISIVKVFGDVDIFTTSQLDECLRQQIDAGNTEIAVDLENCSFIDSEGMKILIKILRSVGEDGQVAICGAKGVVLRAFKVLGLDQLFEFVPSVSDLDST